MVVMDTKNTFNADEFFKNGCGRCSLGGTPNCKVNTWRKELAALRKIMKSTSLVEERKWGVACYTSNGKNIALLGAFKQCCTLSFPKGALLKDPKKLLEKGGEATQSARVVRITSLAKVQTNMDALKELIEQAIQVGNSGQKVETKKVGEADFPTELKNYFQSDERFKKAFQSLTPGRQRGYILFFTSAKKSETRTARIEKYRSKILSGKGMLD
jgi:uncharacterized protein YdeI (YjbR/CyaY-like superfamily)